MKNRFLKFYVYVTLRYRSKYRNRKADSSDDSDAEDNETAPTNNKESKTDSDSLYHHSLSRFFSGIKGGNICCNFFCRTGAALFQLKSLRHAL